MARTNQPLTAAELECPCCGDVGAYGDDEGLFYDGQVLQCGCEGAVSVRKGSFMAEETLSEWEVFDCTLKVERDGVWKEVTVDALRHPKAPGLAITSLGFNVFDITHVESGMLVAKNWERCASAMLELAQLSTLIDWTQDVEGITAQRKALMASDKRVPFEGCTSGDEPMLVRDYLRTLGCWGPEFPWEDESPRTAAERIFEAR